MMISFNTLITIICVSICLLGVLFVLGVLGIYGMVIKATLQYKLEEVRERRKQCLNK